MWKRMALLGFVVGLLSVCGCGMQEDKNKATCKNRLKTIGVGCKMYCMDHDDMWPEKFSQLYPKYVSELETFVCPSTEASITSAEEIDTKSPYVYIPGSRKDTELGRSEKPVIYDKEGTHKGGSNALFGDGHVRWVKTDELKKLLAK